MRTWPESLKGRSTKSILCCSTFLTPVAKTYPSEMGIVSVSQALQCLGGYGYCDEFPVEQFYRDARIHPIHEGTTGIQALDLLGRKVVMQNGAGFLLFLEEVRYTTHPAMDDPNLRNYGQRLQEALNKLQEVTSRLAKVALQGEMELFLADATLYSGAVWYHCCGLAMAPPGIGGHQKAGGDAYGGAGALL